MPLLNPFAAAYILSQMTLDEFMNLEDKARSRLLGDVIGFDRMVSARLRLVCY